MSGILITSGRPKPGRLTASVENPVPPPPRELPRINPVIPGTLVLVTLGIVYFGGLLQLQGEAPRIDAPKRQTLAPAPRAGPVVNRAPVQLPASRHESTGILATVRRLAFLVAKEPTTQATFTDRVAALRNYFALLTTVDRSALFGVTEFSEVEAALASYDPKTAWAMLDRLLMRLQATFH